LNITLTFIAIAFADVISIRNEELILITLKPRVCCIMMTLKSSFIFKIIATSILLPRIKPLLFSLHGNGKSISVLFFVAININDAKNGSSGDSPVEEKPWRRSRKQAREIEVSGTITIREASARFLSAVTKNQSAHSVATSVKTSGSQISSVSLL